MTSEPVWRDAEPDQFAAAVLTAAEQLGVLPLAVERKGCWFVSEHREGSFGVVEARVCRMMRRTTSLIPGPPAGVLVLVDTIDSGSGAIGIRSESGVC
jgi:hypothetical protein